MEENEKPFGCMAEGCNMRFTNEDHLTVHKKKHDMILNLGNGKMNIFVADQTPTPTRFIRNCEEVGLFQDLQNVNPFEETFRKAVEAGKTGLALHDVDSLHVPSGGDDTLHTPHVFPFPHMNDEPNHYKSSNLLSQDSAKHKNKFSDDSLLRSSSSECSNGPVVRTAEIYSRDSDSDTCAGVTIQVPTLDLAPAPAPAVATPSPRDPNENNVVGKETVNVAGKSMALYLRMPDGKLVQLVQDPSTKPVPTSTPIPSPENGLALAKMKLKQALKKNGRIPSSDREGEAKAAEVVAIPPPPPAHRPQPRGGSSYGSGSGEDEGEKKLKFRERNRAAAMRCREKRKTWVQELERRAEDMQATNQHLQSEVTSLRAEVAQLKTLLLAHKNCPITQAMNQSHVTAMPIAVTIHSGPAGLKRPIPQEPSRSVMVLKRPSKTRKTYPRKSPTPTPKRDPVCHRPQQEALPPLAVRPGVTLVPLARPPPPSTTLTIDLSESKVIKVNPNAIRRREERGPAPPDDGTGYGGHAQCRDER